MNPGSPLPQQCHNNYQGSGNDQSRAGSGAGKQRAKSRPKKKHNNRSTSPVQQSLVPRYEEKLTRQRG
jgi:hypothetical protein